MKKQDLLNLEEGTLLVIHGKGAWGLEHRVIRLRKENIWIGTHQGYYYGSLYPFEWLKLATKKDLDDELTKAKQDYENRVSALKKAFELTKKVGNRHE